MGNLATRIVFTAGALLAAWFAWRILSLMPTSSLGHRKESGFFIAVGVVFVLAALVSGKKIIQPDYVTTDIENIIIGAAILFALIGVFMQYVVIPSAEATMATNAVQHQ